MSIKNEKNGSIRKTDIALYGLLVVIALAVPLASYANVSLIYPSSDITAGVLTSLPITWAQGADYSCAATHGFAANWALNNNAADFDITVNGLSGGTVVIDKLVDLTSDSDVQSYKVKITSALSGTLATATTLKLRFWNGTTVPTADGDAGVLTTLDLLSAVNTETATTFDAGITYYVQLVYVAASGSTGSSVVSISPSSIILCSSP